MRLIGSLLLEAEVRGTKIGQWSIKSSVTFGRIYELAVRLVRSPSCTNQHWLFGSNGRATEAWEARALPGRYFCWQEL